MKSVIAMFSVFKRIKCAWITKIALALLLLVLIIFIFLYQVPLHTYEFIAYHTLASHYYQFNKLNTFLEGTYEYYLAPFFCEYLPLRSYYYIGVVHDMIYYPLFKLWPSPYSARLLGLIMLVVQAYFIHKIFKLDFLISFIFLFSCMPYVFPHLVDTGPVSFQTTSIFFLDYLTRRWLTHVQNGSCYSWRYSLGIGLTLFLGILAKVTYFFILPAIIILITYHIIDSGIISRKKPISKTLIRDLLIVFGIVAVLSFFLFFARQPNGSRYYEVLFDTRKINFSKLNFWVTEIKYLATFFLNPLRSAHQVFLIKNSITPKGLFLCSVILALILWGVNQLRSKKERIGFVILNLALFFITLLLMSFCRKVWAMHHVVLTLPFLILALSYLYSKLRMNRLSLVLISLAIMVNLSLYSDLGRQKFEEWNHPSKQKINNLVNKKFSGQYVFIVIDKGMYHLKALYGGRDQCVLYMEPLEKKEQIIRLKNVLDRTKRRAVFIGRTDSISNLKLIKQEFPGLEELRTDFDTGKWLVWFEQ